MKDYESYVVVTRVSEELKAQLKRQVDRLEESIDLFEEVLVVHDLRALRNLLVSFFL